MEILCAQGKLLTLSTQQALEYGFADAQAETLTDLLVQYEIVEVDGTKLPLTEEGITQRQQALGISEINRLKTLAGARITEVEATLADRIVFFLTNPLISSLLLSLGHPRYLYRDSHTRFRYPRLPRFSVCRAFLRWTHADENRCGMGIPPLPAGARTYRLRGLCHPRLRCCGYSRHYLDVRERFLRFQTRRMSSAPPLCGSPSR